jgi:hypothetical protein
LQTTFAPGPNEAFDQEQQENQYRDERTHRQTSEGYSEWHKKDRFHIKYEEYDRVQIVLRSELNLCFTKRFDAAFVSRVLFRTWFRRLKNSPPQPREGERGQWKNQRDANENDDEQIRIWPHRLRSNSLGKHSCQVYILVVEKTAKKFRSFAEAERADRDFYKNSPATNVCGFWWSSSTMGLSKDWREFLELLNSRGVDYVIVGPDPSPNSIEHAFHLVRLTQLIGAISA